MVAGDSSPAEKTKITTKAKGKTLYATLKTAKNKPIAGKKIKFNVKGKNYYRLTNSKGVASIKFSSYSKIDSWRFKATFIGDKKYKQSSKNGIIPKPKITMCSYPSCGCTKTYAPRTRTFVNYCPNCDKYCTLLKNPKRVSEKEFTCGHCDSDFCGNCGKEKMGYSHKYLRKN